MEDPGFTSEQMREHNKQIRRAKVELAQAAVNGIKAFVRKPTFFDVAPSAYQCTDDKRTVQVVTTIDGVPTVFEFTVRELRGKGM